MDYLSELTRIVHEHVPAPVYPDPVPRLSAEIANLREHRPESKREYLDGLERLESDLADLIVQDNQIRDDNAADRSAVDITTSIRSRARSTTPPEPDAGTDLPISS